MCSSSLAGESSGSSQVLHVIYDTSSRSIFCLVIFLLSNSDCLLRAHPWPGHAIGAKNHIEVYAFRDLWSCLETVGLQFR